MGRKRGKTRSGGARSGGGLMSSMRGGFRSAVHSVAGKKDAAPVSPTRHLLTNLITVALLVAAVVFVLRRFGVLN